MIRMLVFGQRLYMTASILVSGTQNYQIVKASFYGQEWDGLTRTVHLSKGEDTETLNLSDGSEVDAWTAFADLDDGIWEVYISGEKRQNGSVIKRITTEAQLLEVRKEGDAGYDLCPSLIQ